jgi:hypothetical protein
VDRRDPKSKKKTLEAIQKRTESESGYPSLMLYPEGTSIFLVLPSKSY